MFLLYVHGKHHWSCWDGQLTLPDFSWACLGLLSGLPVLRAHTTFPREYICICTNCLFVLDVSFLTETFLLYVHGKHQWSCWDGQLTLPHFSWACLGLLSGLPVLRAHTTFPREYICICTNCLFVLDVSNFQMHIILNLRKKCKIDCQKGEGVQIWALSYQVLCLTFTAESRKKSI